MFFGIAVGRLADRIGVRKPMVWGSIGCVAGAALPAIAPGLPSLFISASLIGLSFIFFQVPAQQATGEMGRHAGRLLLNLLTMKGPVQPESVLLTPRIVVRSSTCYRPRF